METPSINDTEENLWKKLASNSANIKSRKVLTTIKISEQAVPTGADQNMSGTPADTINVPGGSWTITSGTATRINAHATIAVNGITTIESSLSDLTVNALYFGRTYTGP